MSSEELDRLKAIEKFIKKPLRLTDFPGMDYSKENEPQQEPPKKKAIKRASQKRRPAKNSRRSAPRKSGKQQI